MHLLNRFFGPFAALLVLSAVYYSDPERERVWASLALIVVALATNSWIAKNCYRYIRWTQVLRHAQIWANFVWALALFTLLGAWWGPMWLLLLLCPVSAAVYGSRTETLLAALGSALGLLGFYWFRGVEGSYAWGQAYTHAAFLAIFPLFIHSLAQASLRVRA